MTAAPKAPLPQDPPATPDEQRDVVKTASLTLSTEDAAGAADRAVAVADSAGGRVDSRSETGGSDSGPSHVSLELKVPAAKLDSVLVELKKLGTVQNLRVAAEDVTQQRVDLDARITALQTSVDRLLGIMRDARDPQALIAAETALSERQADLDSLRAQRTTLGNRIAFSSVDIEVDSTRVPTPASHGGFVGQLTRGWEGLVSATQSAVLLFGLLLPWLAALAVAAALLYLVLRLSTRKSHAAHAVAAPVATPDVNDRDDGKDDDGDGHDPV